MPRIMTISEAKAELDEEIGRFDDCDADGVYDQHIDWLHACKHDRQAFGDWCVLRSFILVSDR